MPPLQRRRLPPLLPGQGSDSPEPRAPSLEALSYGTEVGGGSSRQFMDEIQGGRRGDRYGGDAAKDKEGGLRGEADDIDSPLSGGRRCTRTRRGGLID